MEMIVESDESEMAPEMEGIPGLPSEPAEGSDEQEVSESDAEPSQSTHTQGEGQLFSGPELSEGKEQLAGPCPRCAYEQRSVERRAMQD